MADVAPDQRGVIGGLLALSRNLGLVTGASVMAALYVAGGLRLSFAIAAVLLVAAFAVTRRAH